MNINANKSPRAVRAISFGEMLTSRNLYVVLVVFAVAALGAFLTTAQVTNSTASLQGTLSQAEATKIKIKGAQVSALANLPNDITKDNVQRTLSGTGAFTPAGLTNVATLLGPDKIVVGVVGTNKLAGTPVTMDVDYDNSSASYGTVDRGAAKRFLFSTKDLGQDIPGFEFLEKNTIGGVSNVYIYQSVIPE